MKCTTCGAELHPQQTDLPFKVGQHTTVVVKQLPVLECDSCPEFLIEDEVFVRVEQILAGVNAEAEIEVIPFAA